MSFGSHGMVPGELHQAQPFAGQMRGMRPGMAAMSLPQSGMRPPPHMIPPGHYAMPHRQMTPYAEVPLPEVNDRYVFSLCCSLLLGVD